MPFVIMLKVCAQVGVPRITFVRMNSSVLKLVLREHMNRWPFANVLWPYLWSFCSSTCNEMTINYEI